MFIICTKLLNIFDYIEHTINNIKYYCLSIQFGGHLGFLNAYISLLILVRIEWSFFLNFIFLWDLFEYALINKKRMHIYMLGPYSYFIAHLIAQPEASKCIKSFAYIMCDTCRLIEYNELYFKHLYVLFCFMFLNIWLLFWLSILQVSVKKLNLFVLRVTKSDSSTDHSPPLMDVLLTCI